MSGEIEVQIKPRIRETVTAAVEKIGREDFSFISGLQRERLEDLLSSDDGYVKVTVISVACQVNKSHGDPDPNHSSVSECLKGAIYRIPAEQAPSAKATLPRRPVNLQELKTRRSTPALFDQKSVKLLNFSANTITFLILGYFLGGIALAPAFGLPQCTGLASTSPWLAPCLGSALGLVLGSVLGLAYTYYYFVKKL